MTQPLESPAGWPPPVDPHLSPGLLGGGPRNRRRNPAKAKVELEVHLPFALWDLARLEMWLFVRSACKDLATRFSVELPTVRLVRSLPLKGNQVHFLWQGSLLQAAEICPRRVWSTHPGQVPEGTAADTLWGLPSSWIELHQVGAAVQSSRLTLSREQYLLLKLLEILEVTFCKASPRQRDASDTRWLFEAYKELLEWIAKNHEFSLYNLGWLEANLRRLQEN